jgi:hypothetical protein
MVVGCFISGMFISGMFISGKFTSRIVHIRNVQLMEGSSHGRLISGKFISIFEENHVKTSVQ